ncbi:MAG: tetratricopeptide repeat protein, partial [Chloroflexota bacterium]
MIPIIDQLQNHFPEDEFSWLLSALREDKAVWDILQDTSFLDATFKDMGTELSRWSPASLALKLIDPSISIDNLTQADFSAIPTSISTQAADFYEEFIYNSSGAKKSISLKEAGLLALALRERRRLVGSWDNLESEMNVVPAQEWKTAIACLYGMLPKPEELLESLVNIKPHSSYLQLALHAVLSSPAAPEQSIEALYNLVNNISFGVIQFVLRFLADRRPNLVSLIAIQLLADMDVKENKSPTDLADLQSRLYKAELFQFAGKHADAAMEFENAWDSFEDIKIDRSARLSISAEKQSKNDLAEEIIKEYINSDYGKISSSPLLTIAKLKYVINSAEPPAEIEFSADQYEPVDALAKASNFAQLGDAEQALHFAQKASEHLENDPSNLQDDASEYTQLLISVFQDLGELEKAEQIAKLGLEKYPNDEDLLLNISELQSKNYQAEESIQTAKLASALNPSKVDSRRILAHLLVSNHMWENAYHELDKLVTTQPSPKDEDAISLAACALKINNPTKASKLMKEVLERNPGNPLAHTILGEALLLLNNKPEAKHHFEIATKNAPDVSAPWIQLASMQEAEGNIEESLTTLIAATHATSDDPQLYSALGQTQHRAGNDQKAAKQYEKSIELVKNQSGPITQTGEDICIELAISLQDIGKNQESKALLGALHQKNPAKAKIALAYGKQLRAEGDDQSAIEPLEIAHKSLIESPEAQLEYAQAALVLNEDIEHAINAIHAAEVIEPDNPIVTALKAEIAARDTSPEASK